MEVLQLHPDGNTSIQPSTVFAVAQQQEGYFLDFYQI